MDDTLDLVRDHSNGTVFPATLNDFNPAIRFRMELGRYEDMKIFTSCDIECPVDAYSQPPPPPPPLPQRGLSILDVGGAGDFFFQVRVVSHQLQCEVSYHMLMFSK